VTSPEIPALQLCNTSTSHPLPRTSENQNQNLQNAHSALVTEHQGHQQAAKWPSHPCDTEQFLDIFVNAGTPSEEKILFSTKLVLVRSVALPLAVADRKQSRSRC
jgi:hypothetical protein